MAIKILTPEEFTNYRSISKKFDAKKIGECIEQAQNADLYDILGDFLFDVLSNKDTQSYQDLLSGSTFQIDGETYTHFGLKSLLADFTYARYMYVINSNHTPFGFQQKLTDDSNPVDRNMIKDIVKQTQIDAGIKFRIINKYLVENESTFTRYCTGNDSSINTFGQNFSIL